MDMRTFLFLHSLLHLFFKLDVYICITYILDQKMNIQHNKSKSFFSLELFNTKPHMEDSTFPLKAMFDQ